MILVSDFITKKVGTQGRQDRFYRTYCNNCKSDKGYLLKSCDKRATCNKCAKLGSVVPDAVRRKMSTSALTRSPRVKKLVDGRTAYRPRKSRPNKVLSDAQKKIRHNVRSLVYQKLLNRGLTKNNSTFAALGYSPEELIQHLESRFQPGMSWGNYGSWHIDHIIPDSRFQYSSMCEDGFKHSWSLGNLQPLWAYDNLRKSNKIEGGVSFQLQ